MGITFNKNSNKVTCNFLHEINLGINPEECLLPFKKTRKGWYLNYDGTGNLISQEDTGDSYPEDKYRIDVDELIEEDRDNIHFDRTSGTLMCNEFIETDTDILTGGTGSNVFAAMASSSSSSTTGTSGSTNSGSSSGTGTSGKPDIIIDGGIIYIPPEQESGPR